MLSYRVAKPEDMEAVYRLTHNEYVQMGYAKPREDGQLRHYEHLDKSADTTVFVALDDDKLVGTNTLTLDGECGLHLDEDFPEEVETYRLMCRRHSLRLSSSWRIVTDSECRNSLRVALELMNITMLYGALYRVHIMLFTFNPKHEGFYHKLLGLQTVGRAKCNAAEDAPAIMMFGHYESMAQKWMKVVEKRKLINYLNPMILATYL